MANGDEPNIVKSGKCNRITIDNYAFLIEIYRLETDDLWTLEVVDHEGTSHVWAEQFTSDKEAYSIAVQTIDAEGAKTFMLGNNVIPFRKPRT